MAISKSVKNAILAIVVLGLIIGGWAVWYVFFKPHRNIAEEQASFVLTSKDLSSKIKSDTAAYHQYLDKAILINGAVTSIDGAHVFLDNIDCNLAPSEASKAKELKVGQEVKIQGRVTTYNDLMDEIMLDQCVIK